MTRPFVDVRRATPDDADELLVLWAQARAESSAAQRVLLGAAPEVMRPRLTAALAGDDVHVLLARWDGRPAGYAVLRTAPLLPVVDGTCVHVEHLFVAPALRRHGVGRALLQAVASVAEHTGAEQVVSNSHPNARETHRFLARLGFTPLVVRRVVLTAVLRRRLAGESRRGALEDLLSRRRSLRARVGRPSAADLEAALAAEVAAGDGAVPAALPAVEVVLPEEDGALHRP